MRAIGGKYCTDGNIYKYDGTRVPEDEPLILFRSRDRLAPRMLDYYLKLRKEQPHTKSAIELLQIDIDAIKNWQRDNPELVREPGGRD